MPWGIVAAGVIGAGASLYGASEQAGAAKSAAAQQQVSAEDQLSLQSQMFNAETGMTLPTRELGGLAQEQLAYYMGLTPDLNIAPDFSTPNLSTTPGGGASLNWAGPSSGSAWNAPNPNNPNMPGTYTTVNLNPGYGAPGQTGGPIAAAGGGGGFGSTTAPSGPIGYGGLENPYNPATFYQDPGYQFVSQQGQLALQRSAASSGAVGSGAQLEAAMNYASGLASQEFNNAYQRSMQTESTLYNELTGLSNAGTGATNTTINAAQNTTAGASSAIGAYGNAGAAGTIGAANAITGATNQIAGTAGSLGSLYYMNQNNPYNPSNPNYVPPGYNPANNLGGSMTPLIPAGGGYQYNNPGYVPPPS